MSDYYTATPQQAVELITLTGQLKGPFPDRGFEDYYAMRAFDGKVIYIVPDGMTIDDVLNQPTEIKNEQKDDLGLMCLKKDGKKVLIDPRGCTCHDPHQQT